MKLDNKIRVCKQDEDIIVCTTGHDYDFIATVENKNEYPIYIVFTGKYEWINPINLKPKENNFYWQGILADEIGYNTLDAFKKNQYRIICPEDCDYETYEKGLN